jgi:hypothetical protein
MVEPLLGQLHWRVPWRVCLQCVLRAFRRRSLAAPTIPRWLSLWGVGTGVLGLIGMWRNVTPAVDLVAAANNYLLPAWMIGFGVWLVIASRVDR